MIFAVNSKFYLELTSWKNTILWDDLLKIPNHSKLVVEAVIRSYDAKTKGYLLSVDALLEIHTKFQTFFNKPYVFNHIPPNRNLLTLEIFMKYLPTVACQRVKAQQEYISKLAGKRVKLNKDLVPNSDFDESCAITCAKRLKLSVPDHLLEKKANPLIERVRKELVAELELSIPLFNPVEELMKIIVMLGKKIFSSMCHRRQFSFACFQVGIPSTIYVSLLEPYLVVSGFVKSELGFANMCNKDVVMLAFGAANYHQNYVDPLVRPIFTNDVEYFDVMCRAQGRKGIVVCNPAKAKKEALVHTAKKELEKGCALKSISKDKIARMVVDGRRKRDRICVGIKEVFEVVVDEAHPLVIKVARKRLGQVRLTVEYHIRKTKCSYEIGNRMQQEIVYGY